MKLSISNRVSVAFPWLSVLAVLMIFCKVAGLTDIATLSWFWVLAPVWIPFAVIGGIFLCFGLFLLVAGVVALIADLVTGKGRSNAGRGGNKRSRKADELKAAEMRGRVFNANNITVDYPR